MLMTGFALFMGLLPIMVSDGTGADVMKRIAAPMVGGVISALILRRASQYLNSCLRISYNYPRGL